MNISLRIKQVLPFIILFSLLSMLARELYSANSHEPKIAMVGEQVPAFELPLLTNSRKQLTQNVLKGQVSLLNIWASWCSACAMEHDMLMKIKNDYHIPIYGILYKDNSADAIHWLSSKGNPYAAVGNDPNGVTAIDFGVYGTPETYVIDSNGKIIYRQVGVISQKNWDDVLYPLIKKYQGKE